MFALVNKLLQLAVLLALVVLVVLLWRPARGLSLALAGLGVVMVALNILVQRKRHAQATSPGGPVGIADDERGARLLVTRLLGELTRTQVAYLRQGFGHARAGRAWLKRALPRSYRIAFDQLYTDLEAARAGESPTSLRLTLRILELHRERLRQLDQALRAAAATHPDHVVAHPAAFVVTEHIEAGREGSEPELHCVAGWNPRKATLLPCVDLLTVFDVEEGKEHVRGQVSFEHARSALGSQLAAVSGSGPTAVYATDADPSGAPALPVTPVPLGFLVGSAELA